MKNLIYSLSLLFAMVCIFSCTPCPDCPDVEDDDYDYTAQLKDTISPATFNTWVTNWKTHGQSYTALTLTEYFTMPTVDLSEFLSFPGTGRDTVAAARFVLGLEFLPTDTLPHIMLVGVNSAGVNMIDPSMNQYIYDVSLPCPHMCGKNSLPK